MSLSPMSYVESKKFPRHPVDIIRVKGHINGWMNVDKVKNIGHLGE